MISLTSISIQLHFDIKFLLTLVPKMATSYVKIIKYITDIIAFMAGSYSMLKLRKRVISDSFGIMVPNWYHKYLESCSRDARRPTFLTFSEKCSTFEIYAG